MDINFSEKVYQPLFGRSQVALKWINKRLLTPGFCTILKFLPTKQEYIVIMFSFETYLFKKILIDIICFKISKSATLDKQDVT